MNQSILFPDMQSWDEVSQSVNFAAQQSGALIECFVTKQKVRKVIWLRVRYGAGRDRRFY